MTQRRQFLLGANAGLALAALRLAPPVRAQAPGADAASNAAAPAPLGVAPGGGAGRLRTGVPFDFAFNDLVATARALAAAPYEAPPPLPQDVLQRIDYDAHGRIHYKTEFALFGNGPGAFPVTFFHLGRYFRVPVRMFLAAGGRARELVYDPAYFDMPADSPARELPPGAGFAGFRLQEDRLGDQEKLDWHKNDWVAFLGASYFRAIGELYQYGMSARGVAVNVAVAGVAEEFPAFTRFYFEQPAEGATSLTICALLEGPSLAGAYRLRLERGKAVLIDVEAALFLRRDVARLGLAPLTSMYWYSETIKSKGIDWRPEVHDSDGLALWTGHGERIWRPLVNPPRTGAASFLDTDPRGYGLLQRDRNFDHYLDGVYYDRRPSVWVEPLEGWGAGAVQLVEIPTEDEIYDNVVAMWVPQEPARAGAGYRLHYRLHWAAQEPAATMPVALARCVATRLGRGGQPGQGRDDHATKFVVEFLGGPLVDLPFGLRPEAVIGVARGRVTSSFVEAVPDGVAGHWRALFDLELDGADPVDLRLYLRAGERTLTETWLYLFYPYAP
jgi:glucans biosynthesis protein